MMILQASIRMLTVNINTLLLIQVQEWLFPSRMNHINGQSILTYSIHAVCTLTLEFM